MEQAKLVVNIPPPACSSPTGCFPAGGHSRDQRLTVLTGLHAEVLYLERPPTTQLLTITYITLQAKVDQAEKESTESEETRSSVGVNLLPINRKCNE